MSMQRVRVDCGVEAVLRTEVSPVQKVSSVISMAEGVCVVKLDWERGSYFGAVLRKLRHTAKAVDYGYDRENKAFTFAPKNWCAVNAILNELFQDFAIDQENPWSEPEGPLEEFQEPQPGTRKRNRTLRMK